MNWLKGNKLTFVHQDIYDTPVINSVLRGRAYLDAVSITIAPYPIDLDLSPLFAKRVRSNR